jgi:hypothetical protein
VFHTVADATRLGISVFALHYTDLHRFAAKNSQSVEDDREGQEKLFWPSAVLIGEIPRP